MNKCHYCKLWSTSSISLFFQYTQPFSHWIDCLFFSKHDEFQSSTWRLCRKLIFLLDAKKVRIVCLEKKHYDVSIVTIKMTGTKRCLKRKQRERRAGFYYDRQINNNGNHYWVSSLMMVGIRDTKYYSDKVCVGTKSIDIDKVGWFWLMTTCPKTMHIHMYCDSNTTSSNSSI